MTSSSSLYMIHQEHNYAIGSCGPEWLHPGATAHWHFVDNVSICCQVDTEPPPEETGSENALIVTGRDVDDIFTR
jgi:hypothetical protein